MPYYAVAKGYKTGIFKTWSDCQEQITGFKGPVFKKFPTEEEAEQFVQERGSNIVDKRKPSQKPVVESSNGAATKKDESSSGSKRKNESSSSSSATKKTKLIDPIGKHGNFNVDDEGYLILYTDGACGFNGRKGAQAGIGVYFGHNHKMNVSEPVKGRATNNAAEIQAATKALEVSKKAGFTKVKVNTDSQFMINCITSWLPNWKKNNWIKKDGVEVKNKSDLVDLDAETEGLLIKWIHVKGHDGIDGNEAADKLAREGSKRYVAPEQDSE